MGKKKTPFHAWQTAHKDLYAEKQYIRIGLSLLDHPKVRSLKNVSFKTLVYMHEYCWGKWEFTFPHAIYNGILGISTNGFQSAKKELIEKGFIELIEDYEQGGGEMHKFCFSNRWKEP